MSITENERIYTVSSAARRIKESECNVRRKADLGDLPHIRTVSGARLFREKDLDAYVRRRGREAGEP